jgi:hypothetical protein
MQRRDIGGFSVQRCWAIPEGLEQRDHCSDEGESTDLPIRTPRSRVCPMPRFRVSHSPDQVILEYHSQQELPCRGNARFPYIAMPCHHT